MTYPLLVEIMLFVMWCVEFCNLKHTLKIYISKIVRLEFMFLWSEKRIYQCSKAWYMYCQGHCTKYPLVRKVHYSYVQGVSLAFCVVIDSCCQ